MSRVAVSNSSDSRSLIANSLAAMTMLLPTGTLAFGSVIGRGGEAIWLRAGAGVTFLLALALFRYVANRPLQTPLACLPCPIGAAFLWQAHPSAGDPFGLISLGLFILAPVCYFAIQAVVATGALSLRKARLLSEQLRRRTRWPEDLHECRLVPEIAPLREALRSEAAPVLPLLSDSRPQVRVAALAALEYRKHWRTGQPDLILRLATSDPEPDVRAAAVMALGNLQQRLLLEELCACLRDPSLQVRNAAVEALLWDCERRWVWVRHAVHEALGDARFMKDGPLSIMSGQFSGQAVSDLAAWATEIGVLGVRATQTLALHYSQRLAENPEPRLIEQLKDLVISTRSSAILRIELANLLYKYEQITPDVLDRMIDPTNPAPLRLLAAETMLQQGGSAAAIEVLRQVAKQPNRELALNTAVIVQKYLHVDMGLAIGQPPPPIHTRQAADVTRRVIEWASQTPPPPPEPPPEKTEHEVLAEQAGLQQWD